MVTDRPTSEELVNAVKDFLENKIQPELTGHLAFNTRVAINVLKIVERELAQGENISKEAKVRILDLLNINDEGQDVKELNHLLASKIEEGSIDHQNPDLLKHLWATSIDKLSIDNPRYSSYQKYKDKF